MILKIDKGGTQTNGPKDKEIDDNAQSLIFERWHRHMYQEKKEDEDSLAL